MLSFCPGRLAQVTTKPCGTGALLEMLIRSQIGWKVSLTVHLQQNQRDHKRSTQPHSKDTAAGNQDQFPRAKAVTQVLTGHEKGSEPPEQFLLWVTGGPLLSRVVSGAFPAPVVFQRLFAEAVQSWKNKTYQP